MKKAFLFITGIALTGGWLGCTHVSPKTESSTAMKSTEVGRKLASDLDAGIVGPNGEVILFYKEANKIVIQQCEDNTVLDQRSDCQTKAGTNVTRVPVPEFKRRLKAALAIPGDYTADMKRKIEIFNKQTPIDPVELDKAIKRAQDFIARYGADNAEPGIMDKLQAMKGAAEINNLVDKLVDQIIGQPALKQFVFSKDKATFEFNILRSYIKNPGLSADFVTIKAGSFKMGSPASEENRYEDENLHDVMISRDFSIQTTVVTQAQYFLAMGYNPSIVKRKSFCPGDYVEINAASLCPNNPVESVSWNDAQDFIAKLNATDADYSYRLPTEAEWEFSARGGTQTAFWYGNNTNRLADYAWFIGNAGGITHAVGSKPANQYGLYDAQGNVWQWVQDWYGIYSTNRQQDPVGEATGSSRVVRGGSGANNAQDVRAAIRKYVDPGKRYNNVGFRLVRTAK
ncbi:MAG: formylglycine-generating enzyme family protein [Proteobacteria bacterium]|jgi:formylglycine-generating enzyme required for sulfatase activity|nr:formylglycine-generating enzyme family protein [Pseudomonadota bacterium]